MSDYELLIARQATGCALLTLLGVSLAFLAYRVHEMVSGRIRERRRKP